MDIKPTRTPSPKYPVLATLAVAAALVTPACQQQTQQQQGGVPPVEMGGVIPAGK